MKIKSFFRMSVLSAFYLMVFLGTLLNANAQCPTIPTQPSPICDASGFTFNDLNAFAVDQGNGIVWYNTPTGGSLFNSNQLVTEGTYYVDDNSGTCGTRDSIIVDFVVNSAVQNLDGIYCSNENPTIQTYIDEVLQPNIPVGGSVEVYTDSNITTLANSTDPIPNGATNYFMVFVDASGCKSQIQGGSTAVFNAPLDPNPPSPQEFCSDTNPTVGDLNPGTTETFNWYLSVDGSGDGIPPSLNPTTPLINGLTYYVQAEDFFCTSNAIPVVVSISDPFEPGISASLHFCFDSLPVSDFNLFDELGNPKDTVGSWAGPITTTNGHLGTVNISTLTTPGVYTFTYTVPENGACPEDSSTVTITVYETFTSGIPSALNPATYCEADLPASFDLTTLLDNEDPNGQWTQGTSSSDPIVSSPIDLTTFLPGTYNFTYTQNILPNPCPEESTTVQVIVLSDPNAGIAVNEILCENDLVANSPYDLFNTLDGSQDHNSGIWTDSNGVTLTNPIDITTFTVAGSPYQFTYTIDNGTCSDFENTTITIEPAPESGTPVATFPEFCEGAAPTVFDLFDLLDNEDQTGTWYAGTSNTGTAVTNPIDLSGFTPGTYDFTFDVTAIGTCDDVLVTVQVTIIAIPITGTPTPLILCENDLAANSPLDLFGQLSGNDAGGTWTDDNATGALTGSIVDLTLLTIGVYNYTYSITDANMCTNSSTVTITVEDAPEAGTVNGAPEFCLSEVTAGQTVNLFDYLDNEDQTGTWSDNTPSSQLAGSIVTIDGLAVGTYTFTYDVAALGTCDDLDMPTVSITINDTVVPGATSMQQFCEPATVTDLSATGNNIQWYDEASGGTALPSTTVLVDGETYYATQTDTVTNCESSPRVEVIVAITPLPNSGALATNPVSVCNNTTVDLNSGLDGTQDTGGTWYEGTDATGTVVTNPTVYDVTGFPVGDYQFTYVVSAAPCPDASTTITVAVQEPLNAGTNGILDICNFDDGTTYDLFTLLGGTADTGGTWVPALASTTGVFDPSIDAAGTYTYFLTNSCGNASSEVVVTVTNAPNAGTNGTFTICAVDIDTTNNMLDLLTVLNDIPDITGTFTNDDGANGFSGTNLDLSIATEGTYNFTYTVIATAPCTMDVTAIATVTINDTVAATVINANPEYCLVDEPTVADLDASVNGMTITWYADATETMPLDSTEALIDGEDYYASQNSANGCESSLRVQVNVSIGDAPTPTLLNPNLELCINDAPTINELTLNISEYDSSLNNVVWYDANTNGNTITSSTELTTNTTYYAVLIDPVSGCESSVRLAVTPDLTGCGLLEIPDGFSPNGDGVNDTFDMDNVSIIYPDFEIEIFNRYGNVVYKGNASTARFNGTSNQSRLIGSGDLPVGVYFYIFNFNNGSTNPKQGSLYLSR